MSFSDYSKRAFKNKVFVFALFPGFEDYSPFDVDGVVLLIRLTRMPENTTPSIKVTVNENTPIPINEAVILARILDKIILNTCR